MPRFIRLTDYRGKGEFFINPGEILFMKRYEVDLPYTWIVIKGNEPNHHASETPEEIIEMMEK